MKKIRQKTFETNSSSTHSITVNLKTPLIPIKGADLYVPIGEFGWEYETYGDITNLLSYLYTGILLSCEDEKDNSYIEKRQHIEKLLAPYNINIKWQEPDFSNGYLEEGYIDHSDEILDFVNDMMNDDELLLKYIFNGIVQTGNDNSDGYVDFNLRIAEDQDYYYYYKGN